MSARTDTHQPIRACVHRGDVPRGSRMQRPHTCSSDHGGLAQAHARGQAWVCQAGGGAPGGSRLASAAGGRPSASKRKPKAPVSEAEVLRKQVGGLAAQLGGRANPDAHRVGSGPRPVRTGAATCPPVRLPTHAQNKCCYGCGSVLQCDNPQGAGHVAPEKYQLKKMHRQLSQVRCGCSTAAAWSFDGCYQLLSYLPSHSTATTTSSATALYLPSHSTAAATSSATARYLPLHTCLPARQPAPLHACTPAHTSPTEALSQDGPCPYTPHPHPQVLCERCADLSNGAMIPGVQDFMHPAPPPRSPSESGLRPEQEEAIELLGKALISPAQLRQQLMVRAVPAA